MSYVSGRSQRGREAVWLAASAASVAPLAAAFPVAGVPPASPGLSPDVRAGKENTVRVVGILAANSRGVPHKDAWPSRGARSQTGATSDRMTDRAEPRGREYDVLRNRQAGRRGCKTLGVFTLVAILLASMTPAASAWTVPSGNPIPVNGLSPFADPAAAGYGTNGAGITLLGTSNGTYLIPTEGWPVGSTTTDGNNDALSGPVSGVLAYSAPTVAFIGGMYVMWFVGYQSAPNTAAELYVADSPNVNGYYTVRSNFSNGGNSAFGLFDPSLYRDNSGNWWLIWTIEHGTDSPNNSIVSAELTSSGEAFAPSSAYSLLTYNFVNAGMGQISP